MRITIIGAGNVGGALGRAWVRAGHEVVFGVRDPAAEKVQALLKESGASAATIAEAAQSSPVVVLATPWPAVRDALTQAGDLSGKVLIDCTNPLKADLSGLELGDETSGGEQVAAWSPGARVVKAFNTTGAGNMANPDYGSEPTMMPYAGDDADAKAVTAGLIRDAGFEAVDAGPLAQARLLEPWAMLWIYLAVFGGQGQNFAFKLVRRTK